MKEASLEHNTIGITNERKSNKSCTAPQEEPEDRKGSLLGDIEIPDIHG